MRVRIAAFLAGLATLAGITLAPSPAQTWPGYSWVYHGPVGNVQGIGIFCHNGAGPYWLQQGQSSTNKPCVDGNVSFFLLPANYNYLCRPMGTPGGAWWTWYGPSSPAVPDGNLYCWSVHQ